MDMTETQKKQLLDQLYQGIQHELADVDLAFNEMFGEIKSESV
jgi:hypothetical protein